MTLKEFRRLRGPMHVLFEDEEELRTATSEQIALMAIADVVGVVVGNDSVDVVKNRWAEEMPS